MNTTNTTAAKAAAARKQLSALEARLKEVDAAVVKATGEIGQDFEAVAAGAEIDRDAQRRLADLLAEQMSLKAMIERAFDHVEAQERRVFARGIVAGADRMNELLSARDRLAREAEGFLVSFAAVTQELIINGGNVVRELYQLRGRNRQTSSGEIALEVASLAQPEHLQHLLMVDMVRRVRGFRYDAMPPYGGQDFATGVRAASGALRGEFSELMGLTSLSDSEIADVRAELDADEGSHARPPRVEAAETDVDALVASLPDF